MQSKTTMVSRNLNMNTTSQYRLSYDMMITELGYMNEKHKTYAPSKLSVVLHPLTTFGVEGEGEFMCD